MGFSSLEGTWGASCYTPPRQMCFSLNFVILILAKRLSVVLKVQFEAGLLTVGQNHSFTNKIIFALKITKNDFICIKT
jgi:hypothetical protein